jgi:signal transduction histidine kinase
MPATLSETTILIVITSSILLFLFIVAILYTISNYQKKRYQHQTEIAMLKESFDKTLLLSKLAIHEQALDHFSKELHDNIGHIASLININLGVILMKKPSDTEARIKDVKSLSKQLLRELKSISTSLNTDVIQYRGFEKALCTELKKIEKIGVYEIIFNKSGEEYRLSSDCEIILYRICQEILNNVIKYAYATTITITIAYLSDTMLVEIKDNGTGFDVGSVLQDNHDSTGILNMQQRAKMIQADFFISSENDQGTTVKITIPR